MKTLLLSIPISFMASTAFAADAVIAEAVVDVTPVFSWTGGYVGLQGGYAWGDGHVDFTESSAFADLEPDGFIGGIYAGYNYQMSSNVVIGADFDITYADVDGSSQIFEAPGVPSAASGEQELNWTGAARARLGYAVDRFLPYIAGGVAFGDVDLNVTTLTGPGPSLGETYVGWTIGGGFDYAFTDNVIFRAEYRYTDFGSESFVLPPDATPFDMDLETNDVRLGIAYKF